MADQILNFTVIQDNDLMSLSLLDVSAYTIISGGASPSFFVFDDPYGEFTNPIVEITVPGFDPVTLPFNLAQVSTYNSTSLGLTELGEEIPLPDGVYTIVYSVDDMSITPAVHSILRINRLQEKIDKVFLSLDMMECDEAIKKQSVVEITTIYMLISGAIASANNCSVNEASVLYRQVSNLVNKFLSNGCGCTGTNYLKNFS